MTNFWVTQRVLVTGGRGFLGSHLVKYLEGLGAKVITFSKRFYNLVSQQDVELMYRTYPETTLVIHCAANVGGIGYNQAHPSTLFFDNLMMGALVLEGARHVGIPKFVGIGTICSYPSWTALPFREDDLWDGYPEATNAPYGLAKKMLIVQSQAYRQEFGTNAINLLLANLYGEGDNFDPESSHVIPGIIRKMVEAKEQHSGSVTLWGTGGGVTREFLHVDDAVRAIALAAENYNEGEPVNVGTGKEISIHALARKIRDLVGFKGTIEWDIHKPSGQARRVLDTQRARDYFGFEAQIMIDEGLSRTIQWYLANR